MGSNNVQLIIRNVYNSEILGDTHNTLWKIFKKRILNSYIESHVIKILEKGFK